MTYYYKVAICDNFKGKIPGEIFGQSRQHVSLANYVNFELYFLC